MMTKDAIVATLEDIVANGDSKSARIQAIKLVLGMKEDEPRAESEFDKIDGLYAVPRRGTNH
jgi:hypothetical protein